MLIWHASPSAAAGAGAAGGWVLLLLSLVPLVRNRWGMDGFR